MVRIGALQQQQRTVQRQTHTLLRMLTSNHNGWRVSLERLLELTPSADGTPSCWSSEVLQDEADQ